MKLLFIADSTSIHTKRWVGYFLDRHHDIYLITIGIKREAIPGVTHLANFEQFYYTSASFLPVLLKTRKIIRALRPDIVHGHFIHQYGWLAALSGFHPLVLTAWGTDILKLPEASRTGIGRWLTGYALKKADMMTATSEHLKAEMVRIGADPGRVKVFFWGVDPGKFRPDIDTSSLRRELNIREGQPVVLSNRNFLPLYNNDVVIEAMSLVRQQFPDAVLILQNAGGYLEDDLKQRARKKEIASSVIFLPQYPHEDLPPLYALADVYVSVPSWDAGPVSLKEAMASHATPVISAVPGPMEWVQDNINGRVVPIRNPVLLAGAVCDLLADAGKRDRFNRLNRESIETRADHHDIMSRVEKELYGSLLKDKADAGIKQQMRQQDRYYFQKGYCCNLDSRGRARPFLDDPVSSSRYQFRVYEYARNLIRRHGLKNVLDIGCGFGMKLKQVIFPVCGDITGIDQQHAVSFCRKEHNFGMWLVDDLENPAFPLAGKFDLILSVEVLEHLANPDCLLAYIRRYCHDKTHVVLSTPERDLEYGRNHFGPPSNPTHVREWNREELNAYIRDRGFAVEKHFLAGEKFRSPVGIVKRIVRFQPLKMIQVVHCRPAWNKK